MPEVQEGGGVRHAFGAQINAGKTLQRMAVVERVFERLVGQPIPLLEEIDAQHPLQTDGWATALALGIMRLNDGQQLGPRDDFLHAGEELFAAGGLLLGGKLGVGKGDLVGHASLTRNHLSSFKNIPRRLNQRFPRACLQNQKARGNIEQTHAL